MKFSVVCRELQLATNSIGFEFSIIDVVIVTRNLLLQARDFLFHLLAQTTGHLSQQLKKYSLRSNKVLKSAENYAKCISIKTENTNTILQSKSRLNTRTIMKTVFLIIANKANFQSQHINSRHGCLILPNEHDNNHAIGLTCHFTQNRKFR